MSLQTSHVVAILLSIFAAILTVGTRRGTALYYSGSDYIER